MANHPRWRGQFCPAGICVYAASGKRSASISAPPGPATHHFGKGEIGHDGAGCPDLVSIVKVVHVWIIEVCGFLYGAQAKRIGEEAIVLARIGCHCGNVMKTLDAADRVVSFRRFARLLSDGKRCSGVAFVVELQ